MADEIDEPALEQPAQEDTAPKPPDFDIQGAIVRLQEQMTDVLGMLTDDRNRRPITEPAQPDTRDAPGTGTEETQGPPTIEPDRRPNNAHWFFKKRGGQ